MTTSEPGSAPPAPPWRPIDPHQRRVLGVLIEKAKTTPAAYPLSVNAIVTGCNQKNNRDPVMALEELEVERALESLRALRAVSEVDWIGRVSRFKHHAYEWLGVSKAELAVMAELLLRGAQTVGELRSRAARMEPIADLAALKPLVEALLARGLMIALDPPGRGQRVSHDLYLAEERAELKSRHAGATPGAGPSGDDEPGATAAMTVPTARPPSASPPLGLPRPAAVMPDAAESLRAEIIALRVEVERLRERVAALETRPGERAG